MSTISLLLLGACSSNTGQGGGETGSPIPKEPMPGSPAAEMQKPQTSPANPSPGGGAR
ncbi:MAG: hypothetical protein ACREQQ_12000 [Candidatus Binatia bacterium]